MSTIGSVDQLASLLDRVGRLYPGGIPTDAIEAGNIVRSENSPRCAIIAVGAPEPLDAVHMALAQAVCTKGLRLSLEQCAIVTAPTESPSGADLESLISRIAAPVVIVCGGAMVPGTVKELSGAVVLASHSLAEIAEVVETKRSFWEHLKLIMPRLS